MATARFKKMVRMTGWVVIACTLAGLGMGLNRAYGTTTYTAQCHSYANIWRADEGGVKIGNLTITITECSGSAGHLTSGTQITQSYSRTPAASTAGYQFSGQGITLYSSSSDQRDWLVYGHAKLCPSFPTFGQVCGFDEQFVIQNADVSPYFMVNTNHITGSGKYNGAVFGTALPRSSNEKGYHLIWTNEGTPT